VKVYADMDPVIKNGRNLVHVKNPAAETAGRKSVKVKKRLSPPLRGGD